MRAVPIPIAISRDDRRLRERGRHRARRADGCIAQSATFAEALLD